MTHKDEINKDFALPDSSWRSFLRRVDTVEFLSQKIEESEYGMNGKERSGLIAIEWYGAACCSPKYEESPAFQEREMHILISSCPSLRYSLTRSSKANSAYFIRATSNGACNVAAYTSQLRYQRPHVLLCTWNCFAQQGSGRACPCTTSRLVFSIKIMPSTEPRCAPFQHS